MNRRILILGGSRFHGYSLALHLARTGNDVSVLNRGRYRHAYPKGIRHLKADRDDAEQLHAALKGLEVDAVIDNNAYRPSQVTSILEAMQTRCGHYLLTSTAAVYLRLGSARPLREDAATGDANGPYPRNVLQYARNKFRSEWAAVRHARHVPITIIRLPNVFGEGDFSGKLIPLHHRLQAGAPIPVERETRSFSVVYAGDVVKFYAGIVLNPVVFFSILNFADPHPCTVRRFLEAMCRHALPPTQIARIPAPAMWKAKLHAPFVWGPLLDTSAARRAVHTLDITPLVKWAGPALKWQLARAEQLQETPPASPEKLRQERVLIRSIRT